MKKNFILRSLPFASTLLMLGVFWLSGCKKSSDNPGDATPSNKLYISSNEAGGNVILTYNRNGDGTLSGAGSIPTGGKGSPNPMQILGPQDDDHPMTVSGDARTLYVVNSGSNTITAFQVNSDGTLSGATTTNSFGINPVSVGYSNGLLFVVNKNQDPGQGVQASNPNYYAFTANGTSLSPNAGSLFATDTASSPSFALPSRDGKFLFGTDFLAFKAGHGTLRSFVIGPNGVLTNAPNSPSAVPANGNPMPGGALGLVQHPALNILYVGFPMKGSVGVYSINPTTGELSYLTEVMAGRAACWLRTNVAGTRLYVLNSADATVQVYDISNAQAPVSLQVLALKNPGTSYDAGPPLGLVPTSQPFHEELSPDGSYLYVLSQHTNKDVGVANGNLLHTLKVDVTGMLTEPSDPTSLAITPPNRPQGIVVY